MTDIEILESTYFDKCTIKRKEKIKNPQNIQRLRWLFAIARKIIIVRSLAAQCILLKMEWGKNGDGWVFYIAFSA